MSLADPVVAVSRSRWRAGRVRDTRGRPALTPLDLFYLAYLGPLRWLARLMPAAAFLRCTRPLGSAYARARRGEVAACEGVMRRALGEREAATVRRYAVDHVERFAQRALEDLVMARRVGAMPDAEVEGEEVWRAALSEGRGLLLFSGHFYASRLARAWLEAHRGLRIRVVRGGVPPPRAVGRFGRRFLQPAYDRLLSRTCGNEILLRDRRSASLLLLRVLRGNGVLYSNLDAVDSRDLWRASFLDHHRVFPGGLLDLARLTGAPLVPVEFLGDTRRLRLRFLPRVDLDAAPDRTGFVVRNLPKLVAQLERTVREHPSEWEGWSEVGKMTAPSEGDRLGAAP